MTTRKSHRPVIGITLDQEPAGGYANAPWYALRENYADALQQAGATALALPSHMASIEHYLTLCDGLLISGGGFDIDPTLFGAEQIHDSVHLKPTRTRFERALISAGLSADIPILGICGGAQLLAVQLGACLIQHIPDEVPNALNHSPSGSLHNPVGLQEAHRLYIEPETQLHQICQTTEAAVNSSHHQAVSWEGLPASLRVSAVAPDGVIEGIESRQHRFCIGVQWHPEYQRTLIDQRLFRAFVDACS